ncbi:MAG: flavodoxin [Eubacteriales bacterium]
MKKLIKMITAVMLALCTVFSFAACGGGGNPIDNNPEKPVTGESKILIAYFSWSGNTQQLANMIAEETGGDLFRIVPETPYTNDDVFDRAQSELNNGVRPALSEHIEPDIMAEYDVIFVGFPIWWYDLPMPVWSFLEEYDLSGKTIIPFFSHNGSSSGAGSLSTLQRLCPDSTVLREQALSVSGNSVGGAKNTVANWVNGLRILTEE